MYNFLANATKERILIEIRDFLRDHPVFKKLEVYNRYPFKERVQEGVVLKNVTASRTPLSADSFQGTIVSYVALAKYKNKPGLSIEWAKEDGNHLASRIYKEDVSSQFTNSKPPSTPTTKNSIIVLQEEVVKPDKSLEFANSIKDVKVYVNNSRIVPKNVDGLKKTIELQEAPPLNSKVEVTYWVRNLAPAGIYQIEIIEGDTQLHQYKFKIDALLDKNEILIKKARGDETSTSLAYSPIFTGSLVLYENGILMEKDTDYIIDENNGIITFIKSPLANSKIEASYRIQGLSTGPFEIEKYNTANNTALPGVVLAFGRGITIGDKQFVIINKERAPTAHEYSGKWEMSMSLDVYAKDSIQVEEISDLVTAHLLVHRKPVLDTEGIYFVDCAFDGESEEIYDDATGQPHYIGSVTYNLMTEWLMHKPILRELLSINLNDEVVIEIEPYIPQRTRSFERII